MGANVFLGLLQSVADRVLGFADAVGQGGARFPGNLAQVYEKICQSAVASGFGLLRYFSVHAASRDETSGGVW